MLVSSGQISLGGTGLNQSMTIEAGRANNSAGTVTASLNDPDLRQIAGIPNAYSQISFFDFYGKSSTITLVIGANAQNVNLYTLAGSPVFAKKIILTINPGVYIGSTSTSTPALNIGTGWPAGTTITIINNGYILGAGGAGGAGGNYYSQPGIAGAPGGPALNLTWPITITNNGYIFGGGGGGKGGNETSVSSGGKSPVTFWYGGGGGGGGAGYNAGGGGSGGSNAAPGQSGGPAYANPGSSGSTLAGVLVVLVVVQQLIMDRLELVRAQAKQLI